MNEKEYYSPDLSEFRQGFVYERDLGKHLTEHRWEQMSFKFNTNELFFDGHFRVKFLDTDDILSLGFVPFDEVKYKVPENIKGVLRNMFVREKQTTLGTDTNEVLIYSFNGSTPVVMLKYIENLEYNYWMREEYTPSKAFSMYVKNLFELKELLKNTY